MVSVVQNLISKEANQHNGLITIVRPHWFYLLTRFSLVILLVLLLVIGFSLAPSFVQNGSVPGGWPTFLFFSTTATIFIWLFAFVVWIENYFDILIVTHKKIININQRTLFLRRISEVKFERIQDVTVEVGGLFSTFLNYGHLQVQSAGENEWFTIYNIPDPYAVKNLIMDLQKEAHMHETNELGEIMRKELHHDRI